MARIIRGIVPIESIVIDNELYPRVSTNWMTIYKYSQAMNAGAKFPPIILAKYKGKNILVDGRHRMEAVKTLKKKNILAQVHIGWDKKKIFEEAIKTNIGHGTNLSPYEVRMLVVKLRLMKYKDSDISDLVKVPLGKLEKFVAQGAINSITGKRVGETVIIKSPLKHLAGGSYSPEQITIIENSQYEIAGQNQVNLFTQAVTILENNLLDVRNGAVMEQIDKLKDLLNKI